MSCGHYTFIPLRLWPIPASLKHDNMTKMCWHIQWVLNQWWHYVSELQFVNTTTWAAGLNVVGGRFGSQWTAQSWYGFSCRMLFEEGVIVTVTLKKATCFLRYMYPAHKNYTVSSPGFKPTTLWLRVQHPNHSATRPFDYMDIATPCIFYAHFGHIFFAFQHNFVPENHNFMISGINLGHLGVDLSNVRCKKCFRGSFTPFARPRHHVIERPGPRRVTCFLLKCSSPTLQTCLKIYFCGLWKYWKRWSVLWSILLETRCDRELTWFVEVGSLLHANCSAGRHIVFDVTSGWFALIITSLWWCSKPIDRYLSDC
jgi:hypothetical protein